jgi:RsiW-degrading membrane proteinase PrsW (M82 family)
VNGVLVDVSILLIAAFVPSLIYLVWIRNTEKYGREPYGRLLRIFIFGAVLSIVVAVVFELVLISLLNLGIGRLYEILGENHGIGELILVCVIAPFVEEMAKGLGVVRHRRGLRELEDGIVFGASAGLGFAATENLLYEGVTYFSEGAEAFIVLTIVRSLSSAILHAGASSLMGLGIARSALQGRSWVPYYLGAVLMHSLFNFAASFGALFEADVGPAAYLVGLLAAFVIAISGISMARRKIRALESGRAA